MTNEYGSEQPPEHEQEEHAATPEAEATVHEGEPGVWTDDQPPHDDFGAANEDMATVSQEAATDAEQEEASAGQAKSSRSMLPILAGLGGILLLGGVVYLQFGGHSSPPAPPLHLTQAQKPAQDASTSQLPTQASLPADASPPTSAQANPNEADINALYKPAGTPTPVTMPPSSTPIESTLAPIPTPPPMGSAPATNTASSQDSPTKTVAAQVSPPAPTIAPQPGNPSNPVPPLPGQVFRTAPPSVNTPTANTNLTANASASAGDTTRLNALATRMDTLQKSLDQVTNMVAAVPAMANHNEGDVEGRLNKIEQTLTKIESEQAAKPSSRASKQVVASSAASESNEEYAPPVSHSTKSSTKHKHTRTHTRAASPSTHHHTSTTASSAKSVGTSSEWVLRAATPKEAWVSSDPNSQDLRHVQIGESLPGIGVVHTIRQANGGWQIEGSNGIIR